MDQSNSWIQQLRAKKFPTFLSGQTWWAEHEPGQIYQIYIYIYIKQQQQQRNIEGAKDLAVYCCIENGA